MLNFTYYIPTVIHFGCGQVSHLTELTQSGKKVLMVYGGGSIKRSGLYDRAIAILKSAGLEVFELGGVEPNPKIQSVYAGVEICKANNIDMVLAVGGGSSIDCAKVIAAGALYDGDAWDLVTNGSLIKGALPIYTVLTLAATGSEMDAGAVISNDAIFEKIVTHSPFMLPKMSIMDPEYTFTVSPRQTSAGTADMMSHTLENYFTDVPGAVIQARLAEAILKTCIENGPKALANPKDYDARANLMWAGSLAINGLIKLGAPIPWNVHPIEHELSVFYGATHGEGLAILTPPWMKLVLEKDPSKAAAFATYARNVWGVVEDDDDVAAKIAIDKTAEFFFETMKMPANLRAIGVEDKSKFEIMAEKASKNVAGGGFVQLYKEDIIHLFDLAF